MRKYLVSTTIVAASVCALPAAAPLADEIRQPWAATSTSRDPHHSEDTWQPRRTKSSGARLVSFNCKCLDWANASDLF